MTVNSSQLFPLLFPCVVFVLILLQNPSYHLSSSSHHPKFPPLQESYQRYEKRGGDGVLKAFCGQMFVVDNMKSRELYMKGREVLRGGSVFILVGEWMGEWNVGVFGWSNDHNHHTECIKGGDFRDEEQVVTGNKLMDAKDHKNLQSFCLSISAHSLPPFYQGCREFLVLIFIFLLIILIFLLSKGKNKVVRVTEGRISWREF